MVLILPNAAILQYCCGKIILSWLYNCNIASYESYYKYLICSNIWYATPVALWPTAWEPLHEIEKKIHYLSIVCYMCPVLGDSQWHNAMEIILVKNRMVEMTSGFWRGENFLWAVSPQGKLDHVSLKGPGKFRGELGAAGTEMQSFEGRKLRPDPLEKKHSRWFTDVRAPP